MYLMTNHESGDIANFILGVHEYDTESTGVHDYEKGK